MTAIDILRESYQQCVHLPKDLSVVGFDDILLAVIPPLTTVKMSQTEIARWAFKALLADVERTTVAPNGTEYQLRTNLVLGDSTAMARHRRLKLPVRKTMPLIPLHDGASARARPH